jgi:cytochrome c-type biogenesis protein CcmH
LTASPAPGHVRPMLFWILIALISAVVVVALTYPLLLTAKPRSSPQAADAARAIYDAQMAELDREAAQGTLTAAELESAKAELGRRLLKAIKNSAGPAETKRDAQMKWLSLAVSVAVPVGALAIYLEIGAPGVPSQTNAARQAALQERARYENVVGALEAALAAGKGDAQGWRLLAQAYRNLNEPAKSLDALKRAVPWLKDKGQAVPADLWAALGTGLVAEAQGTVTPPAAEALRGALAAEPSNMAARFYLGLERAQAGDGDGARGFWTPLLADLPEGMPLRTDLEKRLKDLPPPKP